MPLPFGSWARRNQRMSTSHLIHNIRRLEAPSLGFSNRIWIASRMICSEQLDVQRHLHEPLLQLHPMAASVSCNTQLQILIGVSWQALAWISFYISWVGVSCTAYLFMVSQVTRILITIPTFSNSNASKDSNHFIESD